MITEKQKEKLVILETGFALGGDHVMLVECTLKKDIRAGQKVAVICIGDLNDKKTWAIVPMAVMLEEPFEFLTPPSGVKTEK